MFNEVFFQVLNHEGVVSISTTGAEECHAVNTWNSYLVVKENTIYIPAAGMRRTEKNVANNSKVKLTLGSKEVQGHIGMGTGFLLEGTASFLTEGAIFDEMKTKFPFLSRVLAVEVTSSKQTL